MIRNISMKRMFIFSIVISCLLLSYSAVAAAPEANAPNGKSMYSSRPNRALRTWSEETPVLAPAADQTSVTNQTVVRPTPMLPTPVVPAQPNTSTSDSLFLENKTFSNKSISDFSDFSSTVPVLAPPNQFSQPNPSQEIVVEKSMEVRPLSKIDVNSTSTVKAERTEVYKKTDESSGSNFISRPTFPNQPVSTENYKNKQEEQLDELNARLAKIQLEKHNLNETLKLISKIKSSVIKAKTLVDLAEYVSRDGNYKKEADQLFALAVDGVDALTKGEAIVIKIKEDLKTESVLSSPVTNMRMSGSTVFNEPKKPTESKPASTSTSTNSSASTTATPSTSTPLTSTPPRKTSLTLLEEDKPIDLSSPKTESTSKTIQKPEESPTIPSSTSAVSSVPSTSAKKTPTLLDDEPEQKPTLEEKINAIKKETISSSVPAKRPLTLLDAEPETPKSETIKSEPLKEEKPVETKTPTPRKPSLLLPEEPEIDNKENEKETTTKITEPVKTETVKKDEPETTKPDTPPSTTKPPRRSTMPGRPRVILEEN
jgi:hypothetical protein